MKSLMDELFELLDNCDPNSRVIYDRLDEFVDAHSDKVAFSSGETRMVVVFKHEDFVLKIPRYGYCQEDYCLAEMRAYESGKKYRIEKILLPIELYHHTHSGIDIYKQVKYSFVTGDMDIHDYSDYLRRRNNPRNAEIVGKVRCNCYDGHRISRDWMARVIQLYGKKFARSFENWVNENQVNDLHNYNTGWLNNKPVLVDYAGYRG